ncbi:sialin isoform X2 [Brachionus plicatilis]|uniref:Sialin isoform X2 n=1 Tax=Brachionus plicatilis TaxID=10195 RepID=A0A3M7S9Q2_BRAPC|nr:sialin isoform X2 [Brachionus plicatilis]
MELMICLNYVLFHDGAFLVTGEVGIELFYSLGFKSSNNSSTSPENIPSQFLNLSSGSLTRKKHHVLKMIKKIRFISSSICQKSSLVENDTTGSLGILWFILFVVLTADSPHDHRFISSKEKSFVLSHTCDEFNKINEEEPLRAKLKRPQSIPWMSIFTSKACIAIFTAHLCHNWGNYMFLTQLPSFMKDVLRFDIKSNGLFSSIPYISCWACAIISSIISDRLIISEAMSTSKIRKIFNGIGLLVPMMAVVLLSFVTCKNPYLGIGFLAYGVGFLGCNSGAGFQVNINEIGGEYSGILFGISNTIATVSGIVSPYIVGVMTPNSTQQEWQRVFYLTAVIYLFGAIVYILFSKATVENWAQNTALIADGSEAIRNAFTNVFGHDKNMVMCWAHMKRCVDKKLTLVTTSDK